MVTVIITIPTDVNTKLKAACDGNIKVAVKDFLLSKYRLYKATLKQSDINTITSTAQMEADNDINKITIN